MNFNIDETNDGFRLAMYVVSAITAVCSFFYFVRRLHFVRVYFAARALTQNEYFFLYSKESKAYQLPRPNVTKEIESLLGSNLWRTILIYGNRGVGKTTAISQWGRRRQRTAVLHWKIGKEEDADKLFEKLKKSCMSQWIPEIETENDDGFVVYVLRSMEPRLIVVISINKLCTKDILEKVLQFCKDWGADMNLVRFLVDMSSCWSAVDMDIGLQELRARGLHVPHLTLEEANSLVTENLPSNWAQSVKNEVVQLITSNFNLTPLKLTDICGEMYGGMNIHEAKKRIETKVATDEIEALESLQMFDLSIRKKFQEEYPHISFPKDLVKEEKINMEALEALKSKLGNRVFVGLVQAQVPHILSFDPFSHRFSVDDKIMKKKFIEYYSKKDE
mmetsp:Transcript_44171/g.106938  ORF Transcript_44171/g.106938 Transcript_44171/m.106938 type:complete len:390 (+) Transcript_44171:118-1287(+)|eukprot:CAMPEP_0113480060 /NCGR_PEP_ID=MMETSP0014_2-20120614/21658_1 /TAXON_ID=2857 /ORGANISM="Nitzschia sp." /LENGTH=389 /DNA_ID=CAMNT_0000373433 /DNA_START=73 /DNA_END=1242 /DNA_ORIENTATION=+ /assembly_acc=CAM_ASM_000159